MPLLREPASTNSLAKTLDEQVGLGRSWSVFSTGRRRGARVRARSVAQGRHGARFTELDQEAASGLPAPLLTGPDGFDGTAGPAELAGSDGSDGPAGSGLALPSEVRPVQAIDLSDGPRLIVGPEPFRPGRFTPEPFTPEAFAITQYQPPTSSSDPAPTSSPPTTQPPTTTEAEAKAGGPIAPDAAPTPAGQHRADPANLTAARWWHRIEFARLTLLPAEPSRLLEPCLIAALSMIATVVAGATAAPSQAWILIAVLPVVGLIALLLPGDDLARAIRAGAILSAVACLPMLAPSLAVLTLVIALATIAVYPALVGESAGRAVLSMAICTLATPLAVATLVHRELTVPLQMDPTAGMITGLRLALLAAIPAAALIGSYAIAYRRTLTSAGVGSTGTGPDHGVGSIPRQGGRTMLDMKTGLPDRDTLLRTTDAALQDRPQVGLVLVSIDRFADLRDSLGAVIADDVAERVARRLHREFPAERLVAQVDHHQFAILLADATGDTCGTAAGRIAALMKQPIISRGHELAVTCSMGCAVSDSAVRTAEELLRAADEAGQSAARSGRSRWLLFDRAVRVRVGGREKLEADLRDAVRNRSIEVAFQPVLALGSGDREDRIVGAEALPRWTRPDSTVVEPTVFLPLADELGIGSALGMQVIERALAALVIWRHEGVGVDQIWVNVLPSQLEDPEFGYEVAAQLAIRGLSSSSLVMEISATRLPESQQAVATVNLLGSLGIAVALDDVTQDGDGRAPATPADLPISAVKFRRAPQNDADPQTAVTRTIAQRCRALGLRVVLEGVETVGQLDTARDIGADAVQGFAIARPMSAEDVTNLLTLRLPGSFRLR